MLANLMEEKYFYQYVQVNIFFYSIGEKRRFLLENKQLETMLAQLSVHIGLSQED